MKILETQKFKVSPWKNMLTYEKYLYKVLINDFPIYEIPRFVFDNCFVQNNPTSSQAIMYWFVMGTSCELD